MAYQYIGKDVIRYFNYVLLSYFMLFFIVFINTYKTVSDYYAVRKKSIKRIRTSAFDIIVSMICGTGELFGIIFTGILTDTYTSEWFDILFVLSICSFLLFIIEAVYYLKLIKEHS